MFSQDREYLNGKFCGNILHSRDMCHNAHIYGTMYVLEALLQQHYLHVLLYVEFM